MPYQWQSMSHSYKLDTVAKWLREGTPPNGIAFLLGVSDIGLTRFVNEHLPTLANQYAALRLTRVEVEERALRNSGDETYPPMQFKKRHRLQRRYGGR